MQTSVNGKAVPLDDGHPDETAIEVIHERCGLTGTKLACGAGVCGACTMLVNGVPMISCLLPAHTLANRDVQTIEAWDRAHLHPVQKAFMAHDALQCGFCTPGFIVEGIAFHDRWRKQHGDARPTRNDIADALAGHLCRCGAYIGIYAAIGDACEGKFDGDTYDCPRIEALEKVTGEAKCTVDVRYNGQLEGVILRSPHPHAKVLTIDFSEAQALDGVRACVTLINDERIVRYVGQEIAAVAATDLRTARAALEKIKVEYDVRPAVISAEQARAPRAPIVWDKRSRSSAPSEAEGMLLPATWSGNTRAMLLNVTARRPGKAKRLISEARQRNDPLLIDSVWHTAGQIHTPLEPHACVAKWNADGSLTVHLSTQAIHRSAREIAKHFGLHSDGVQVLAQHVGGGFGAKLALGKEAIAAATLSKAANAPVRMALSRAEEMSFAGYRPLTELRLALLASPSGELRAMQAPVYSQAGVAVGAQIAALYGFIYGKAPRDLRDFNVVTHNAPGAPFRGPGGPVGCWALEQAVDEMAYRLNEDPIQVRKRWDPHLQRQKLYDWAAALPVWREREAMADKGRFRRGIGVAAAAWYYIFHAATEVEVRASPEGIVVETATQDMGNGSRTVLARAVADAFEMAPHEIIVKIGNSRAPRGPMSGGSRTTTSLYAPAFEAAQTLRQTIFDEAVQALALEGATSVPSGIRHASGFLTWQQALSKVAPRAVKRSRGLDHGLPAIPLGLGADNFVTGRGFTGAVHVSEVEVDTRLGKIRPLRAWSGLATGKIHAPVLARSQCYGGVIQGIGFALYEAKQVDLRTGHNLTSNLEDYRIPGIGDTPEIEIHFLEEGFDHVKGKGVGLSELSTLPVAASIGNAVRHATGVRFYNLPIRPEDIVK